jgi:GT2 family glycosyltransferase
VNRARTTVVIATRDRADELSSTVRKLLGLRPRPPVIVLDNASEDDTAERVSAVACGVPDFRLISLTRNAGAAARNLGVQMAQTPYVAFSDDDSWWAPDALPRAEAILDEHPRVGLLAASTLVGPREVRDPVCDLMERSPLGGAPDLPGPRVLGFLACSAIVRRTAFLDAGGFSHLLHFAAEEKLLSYDLAARGWELCYVSQLRAHHHPSSRRPPSDRRRNLELRNNALIAWMRRPVWTGVGAGTALARALAREPGASAAALGALLRLPRALLERRPLPGEIEARVRLLEGESR